MGLGSDIGHGLKDGGLWFQHAVEDSGDWASKYGGKWTGNLFGNFFKGMGIDPQLAFYVTVGIGGLVLYKTLTK